MLSISKQCQLLNMSRSSYYYRQRCCASEKDLTLLLAIRDELTEHPFYGYRKVAKALEHLNVTAKQVRQVMKKNGLRAIYPKKNLSDLYSRKVLSWGISNTLDASFCLATFRDAVEVYGVPAIFNSDQGSQFTSSEFIAELKSHNIRISMDGKGRAFDNIYVERLWRSLKYEKIYLKSYNSIKELKEGVEKYFDFYNTKRFHQALDYAVPDDLYNMVFAKSCGREIA